MVFAGLDVGTTGCKIALFDSELKLLETYYNEYAAVYKNGKHEIDFMDVLASVLELLKKAAKSYKIAALGVTSFGESFCMLDEKGNVLAPSMLYTDPRGEAECEFISGRIGAEKLTILSGVKPHPMYSISKILWLKNNSPEIFSKCKRILLGEDFIVYSLTGNAQIDYSLAARTGAFDIDKKCWIDEVFSATGIDKALMSRPVEAGTGAGNILESIKEKLEIDYDIAVVNGCHDQVAAMIGSGVFDPHQAMDGTGTVECIPIILKEIPKSPAFFEGGYSVVPYIGGLFACYAFSFTGGATLKWFRDNFAELEKAEAEKNNKNVYAQIDSMVAETPSDILVLPHFAGAATPYMDSGSKAAFLGITLETTKLDIYKALMEGTSFEMLMNFDYLGDFCEEITDIRATGGGANSDIWLQIKADILNKRITALEGAQFGALGSAVLAGKALGAFDDIEKAVGCALKIRKCFEPNAQNNQQYNRSYKKYKELYSSLRRFF